jgi:hypothetical protein
MTYASCKEVCDINLLCFIPAYWSIHIQLMPVSIGAHGWGRGGFTDRTERRSSVCSTPTSYPGDPAS